MVGRRVVPRIYPAAKVGKSSSQRGADKSPPRVRHRVETALKAKHRAEELRRLADETANLDPLGAMWTRKDAAALETKAEADLSRWSYTTGPIEAGNGGELRPLPEPAMRAPTPVRATASRVAKTSASCRSSSLLMLRATMASDYRGRLQGGMPAQLLGAVVDRLYYRQRARRERRAAISERSAATAKEST